MNAIRVKLLLLIVTLILACNGLATPTSVATDTGQSAAPPATAIQHNLIPVDLPEKRANQAGDADSSTTARNEEAAGGDRFTYGDYERPFNANTMDVYFPHLDIIDTQAFMDDTWIYATIQMQGQDDNGNLPATYAMELDVDRDGKGDWLVLVEAPQSADWSTDGVQVWQDANDDVGGLRPTISEHDLASNDGYETNVFDSSVGPDADGAWARLSPTILNAVELAVKRSLVDDADELIVGMWVGNSLDPARFDINDHMTHEEAGAALRGYENFYPIKGLAEIDNSCRVPVNFVPNGNEPGLCSVYVPDEPGQPPLACVEYGGSCGGGASCCNNVPCTGGLCRYN